MSQSRSGQRSAGRREVRVVAIGGGTGLSALLKGLKKYAAQEASPEGGGGTAAATDFLSPAPAAIAELSAVVTVSDDGGSSGRLRKEFQMLPPGAVRLSSEILATRGHIYPATTANIELEALMQDGTRVCGETKITASKGRIEELFLVPPHPEPLPETLEAIARADLITIGPGSLFTSLIPNLLVRGIPQAIRDSPAVKVYVSNLMTQANESLGRTAADHVRALNSHAGTQLFGYTLINRTPLSDELKAKYALEGASQIVADLEAIEAMGICPVLGDYLSEDGVARHASDRVAHDLLALAAREASEKSSSLST
jgi:2-phospho-L-lactate transferase/gluconeogenesis factor (CofD/UPF0052 family)